MPNYTLKDLKLLFIRSLKVFIFKGSDIW